VVAETDGGQAAMQGDAVRDLPHESGRERDARCDLASLLAASPIPAEELVDNLGLYLGRRELMDLLAMDALYRRILDVPGVVMEFGVRWGRHLGVLTALRALYEPYNVHRRVVGFDTFSGFPDVSDADRGSRHAVPGGLAVSPGYLGHLERVLAVHESTEALSHVRRTICVAGDVRQTLPRYLADNPQTVVALAYLDLDLYEPTRSVLGAIRPYLTGGSVVAFDQVGHAKWPGETRAVREVLGTYRLRLELLPGFPGPVFVRWTGGPD
jgi:hypothetical protein